VIGFSGCFDIELQTWAGVTDHRNHEATGVTEDSDVYSMLFTKMGFQPSLVR
jgi:hypothetical protein